VIADGNPLACHALWLDQRLLKRVALGLELGDLFERVHCCRFLMLLASKQA